MSKVFIGLLTLFVLVLPVHSAAAAARNIAPDDAYALLQKSADLYLLDVRTAGEYQQARLQGARLIPINQLVKRLAEVPKDRAVLVYCAVGSRSAQAVSYLARKGYTQLYNLYGGIYAWSQQGYPVLEGKP